MGARGVRETCDMAESKKTLYIIDGHAQIYAAYYAPMAASLTSPSGEPTKAVYIFTTMLLKILRERRPDMLAVAMDAPGPTFRHQMYDQYKAHRPPMPEDLPTQIKRIEQILAAMNIPML
jgi:DNA polymerase I